VEGERPDRPQPYVRRTYGPWMRFRGKEKEEKKGTVGQLRAPGSFFGEETSGSDSMGEGGKEGGRLQPREGKPALTQ